MKCRNFSNLIRSNILKYFYQLLQFLILNIIKIARKSFKCRNFSNLIKFNIPKYFKQLFQFLISSILLKKLENPLNFVKFLTLLRFYILEYNRQEKPLKIQKFITLFRFHGVEYNKQFLKFFKP